MVTKLQVRKALRKVSKKPSVNLSAVKRAKAMIAINKPTERLVEAPRDYFNKEEMQSLFMELLSKGLPEKPEIDTEKFITMEDVRSIMPSTDGFVKQEDFDKFVKKLNSVLSNIPVGGGGNVPLRDKVDNIDNRLEALVSELTDVLGDISTNTEELTKLESFFSGVGDLLQKNITELKLLNARTEEGLETDITIDDIREVSE